MLNKLSKLINVKSIVTLVLTGVFAYMSASGKVAVDNFVDMFQIILIFYLGTQSGKAETNASNMVLFHTHISCCRFQARRMPFLFSRHIHRRIF